MKNANFSYLKSDYPILFNIICVAEYNLFDDPVTSLFKLRQFGEKLTEILFEKHYLDFPRENTFQNRLRALQYENLLPERVKDLLHTIKNKGNIAVHQNVGTIDDAKTALFSTFKVSKWFYETYCPDAEDITSLRFSLPNNNTQEKKELFQLEADYKALEEKFHELLASREVKEETLQERTTILQRSEKAALKIEMNEDETRILIDQQLREAGWEVDSDVLNHWKQKTLPESNRKMAIAEWVFPNGKRADYALFIDEDLYGVVEAKKWGKDISQDLRQPKLYSEYATDQTDYLIGNWGNYSIPFVFATNGRPYLEQLKTKSGIWFLDVRQKRNQSRPLRGWFTPDGLKELFEVDRQKNDKKLLNSDAFYLQSKAGLGLRDYQMKAIKAVENKIAQHTPDRRALLTMATGTGKTRTTLGLCYRLIKANRFKRILFLVDRTLLAEQALGTFKDTKVEDINTFAQTYQISKMTEMVPELDTRLHFSTVQSLVKRLFYSDAESRLPIDAYDCIIVDEAHRGYLQDRELDDEEIEFKNVKDYVSKYRMVLDYFDAFAIGLTATPAIHTKEIFGKSVFTYSYREAVIDGYLVDHEPPYLIKTKLSEEGITWHKGEKPKVFDSEENSLVELEELEDELNIDIAGFNNLVITEPFNRTVVKQLVQEIDPEGEEKTLIFAANDNHADRVVLLLKEEYAKIGVDVSDNTIEKITGKSYAPKELVKRYKNEKFPTIAVTVDLLSTGVDVPSICNIVFLRRIKSRILYEQMLGRATRLCPEIEKESFRIYDAVRVYETLQEFTSMKPVVPNPSTTFKQLAEEISMIKSNERARKQLDQIITKLQRKKRLIVGRNEEKFKYLADDQTPEAFINMLKTEDLNASLEAIVNKKGLWKFLDELKPAPRVQFWSDHEDEYIKTERGYGKGQKPSDYLNSFKEFIEQNQNKLVALNVICTRPKELDRQSLKELKLLLDEEGFNVRSLNSAWKQTKNEDIAADIIGYIRTLALGSSLVSHEERIQSAVQKVRESKSWNKIQLKWIERFEKQLLQEEIIKREDLDSDPFDEAGGFERLDKIFEHQLSDVLDRINENLYTA